jgi:betaine-aldehyde dehydrogenase
MTTAVSPKSASAQAVVLPKNRGPYYGGGWHEPKAGRFIDTINPGTGQSLGKVADSGADDIDAAVAAASAAGSAGPSELLDCREGKTSPATLRRSLR